MFHNLTPKAQQVLVLAKKLVLKFQQKYLSTDHLLLSILELKQGIAFITMEQISHTTEKTANIATYASIFSNLFSSFSLTCFVSSSRSSLIPSPFAIALYRRFG